MAWSNEINKDRLVQARKLAETTEPCTWEVHTSTSNSPLLAQKFMGHELYMVCTRCGRTFDEIVDIETDRAPLAEGEAPRRHAGGRPRKVVEEAATA
jgi:hypothetical protein